MIRSDKVEGQELLERVKMVVTEINPKFKVESKGYSGRNETIQIILICEENRKQVEIKITREEILDAELLYSKLRKVIFSLKSPSFGFAPYLKGW